MNKILTLLLIGGCTSIAQGRFMEVLPTYQQMFDQSDLVVIARPVTTNTTAERMLLPNISPDIEVAGVETEFEVQTLLKSGQAALRKFVLHHYRKVKEDNFANSPQLVAFDPLHPENFLLFLKKEADGRFAPIYNQTDPEMCVFKSTKIIDLIAIAKPVSPRKQIEEKKSSYIMTHLTGYQTEFAAQKVLLGDKSVKKIVLHHFEQTWEGDGLTTAPGLHETNFQPERDRLDLLVLKKEADGRFTPIGHRGEVEGEATQEGFSVIKLPSTKTAGVSPK